MAERRTNRMNQTGIPYYMNVFGNQIRTASEQLVNHANESGEFEIPITDRTTQFSRGDDKVHDLLRYVKDHMSKREWEHFMSATKLKFKRADYSLPHDELFKEYEFGSRPRSVKRKPVQ